MPTEKKKSGVSDFILFVLDYIYKEMASFKSDLITEYYLRRGSPSKKHKRRILGYWDFNQRLARTGDFLVFLNILSMLRQEFKLTQETRNVDVCFIYDTNHYNADQSRYKKSLAFKKNLMGLPVINPHLGSVMTFNSNEEFNRFYQKHRDEYVRWPPTVAGTVAANCRYMEKFFIRHKAIPLLIVPSEVKDNIYSFYQQLVFPALPIVINIRKNTRSDLRNSNHHEIKKFLEGFTEDPRFKFIIICMKEEIPADLRDMPNVVFSKDHFTDIESDIALINTSYLSIFPSSGMACMAWLADVPFIQHGPHGRDKYTRPDKGGYNFFASYQRHFENPVTAAWLTQTFETLVMDLMKAGLNNTERHKHR